MLYIVNCELVKSYYMGEDEFENINHIVDADSEDHAKEKIKKHYEIKDDPYYLTYYINFNYCNQLIS